MLCFKNVKQGDCSKDNVVPRPSGKVGEPSIGVVAVVEGFMSI